jgi:hypothetical protein
VVAPREKSEEDNNEDYETRTVDHGDGHSVCQGLVDLPVVDLCKATVRVALASSTAVAVVGTWYRECSTAVTLGGTTPIIATMEAAGCDHK